MFNVQCSARFQITFAIFDIDFKSFLETILILILNHFSGDFDFWPNHFEKMPQIYV